MGFCFLRGGLNEATKLDTPVTRNHKGGHESPFFMG
nr:MAG TPA_asm: hypothetical protein [Caudoviricetes sp.]